MTRIRIWVFRSVSDPVGFKGSDPDPVFTLTGKRLRFPKGRNILLVRDVVPDPGTSVGSGFGLFLKI